MGAPKKLSVAEASKLLGISKEAVYNRLRRGSLKSVEQNGIKLVILGNEELGKPFEKESQSEFIEFLKSEIEQLKAQNKELLKKHDELYKQKEELLTQTKNEIKQLYKEKDERVLAFLSALKTPLLAPTIDIEAVVDEAEWISMSDFLSSFSDKKAAKISKKIIKKTGFSKHIKYNGGVIYVRKDRTLDQILNKDKR